MAALNPPCPARPPPPGLRASRATSTTCTARCAVPTRAWTPRTHSARRPAARTMLLRRHDLHVVRVSLGGRTHRLLRRRDLRNPTPTPQETRARTSRCRPHAGQCGGRRRHHHPRLRFLPHRDGTGGSCDLYWYLLPSPTGPAVDRRVVGRDHRLDGTGFFNSGDIGKVLADIEHVLFATAWESDCDVTYRGSTAVSAWPRATMAGPTTTTSRRATRAGPRQRDQPAVHRGLLPARHLHRLAEPPWPGP